MSAKYQKALHRRMIFYVVGSVVSAALVCLGFFMSWVYRENYLYTGSWMMFYVLCSAVLLGPSLYGIRVTRKAQRRGREAEIEEQDERSRYIDMLAWTASGKLTLAALTVAMLISLTLMQFAVFWTCYWAVILERIAYLCFSRWFSNRL